MKKLKFLFFVLPLLSIVSCDDYLDINQNPNAVLYPSLNPSELISAAQTNSYRLQSGQMNELGNIWTNAWAGNVAQVGGGYNQEFALILDSNFYSNIWDASYRNIGNFQNIINYPNPTGVYDNYVAAAKICKVHYMQYIVDLYGDCPYTEAFKGPLNVTPKYNDDQFIYRQLIGELESARNIINTANPNAELMGVTDTMLAGNMVSWTQFANTLELRLLLRMSESTGNVASYRTSKLAALNSEISTSGVGFLSSDVAINPGYLGATTNDQANPFYSRNAFNADNTPTFNWGFICPSGHGYKSLGSYASFAGGTNNSTVVSGSFNYPNVVDPRRGRIYRAISGVTRAVTQGSPLVDVYQTSGSTGVPGRVVGNGMLNPYNFVAAPTAFSDFASNSGFVMTKAEAFFLQAEAAMRGYIPGVATTFYNSGIDASMEYLGVTAIAPAAIPTYKAAIANKIGYSMTAAGSTPAEKLQGLMYQKWVALMGIHGIESFIDYTRTGYPITPLATTATKPNKPNRLIYADSEISTNSANTIPVSQSECFTVNAKSPFWLQGNPVLGN